MSCERKPQEHPPYSLSCSGTAPVLEQAIVEDISLVRVNSAMVERLWSLYNARHKSSGHTFGPGERERVVKKRFNEVYRSGGL